MGSTMRLNVQTLLLTLLLGVVAVLIVTPLFLLLLRSVQAYAPSGGTAFSLTGWQQAFTTQGILEASYNSMSLAVSRQFIATGIGILVAWLLARTDIPIKGWLEFMFWLSFFIPTLPVTLGWILLLDPSYGLINQALMQLPFVFHPPFDIYSYWGIVWVHLTATTLGIKVMLLTPAFRTLDAALEESSRVAGATTLGTVRRIVVPIMLPTIFVTVILGLVRALEAFEVELILGVPIGLQVFSTKILELMTLEPPDYATASALASFFLIVLVLLVGLQKLFLGKKTYTTVSGRGFSRRPSFLGRWRYPAFIFVAVIALTITLVPTAMMVLGTFMKLFGFFTIDEPWTLDHWQQVLADPILLRALKNTVILGFYTAGLNVMLSSLIAYVIVKSRFAGRATLDFISWLPWSIPGVLLSMALLWTYLLINKVIPIYGTVFALALALTIAGIPLSVQLIKSYLLHLGDELEEVSLVCGASWFTTFRRILVPLLFPCLVVVGLLDFIRAARNISTVVLLATGNTRTISLLMLDFAAGGELEKATVVGAITVLMVVVAALLARKLIGQFRLGE